MVRAEEPVDAWAEDEAVAAAAAVGDTSEADGKAAGVDACAAVSDEEVAAVDAGTVEVAVGESRVEAADEPSSRPSAADLRGEPGAEGGADEGADDGADGARDPATVVPDTDGRNFWR